MKKAVSPSRTRKSQIRVAVELARTYQEDETAWLDRMVGLINDKRFADLDYENLAEYLESMARRDRREVKSRLVSLLAHLLKWQFQPRRRSRSWHLTVLNQRRELRDDFDSSGTLRNYAREILADAYTAAIQDALVDTGLAEDRFPATCPFTLEFLLGDQLPEEETP